MVAVSSGFNEACSRIGKKGAENMKNRSICDKAEELISRSDMSKTSVMSTTSVMQAPQGSFCSCYYDKSGKLNGSILTVNGKPVFVREYNEGKFHEYVDINAQQTVASGPESRNHTILKDKIITTWDGNQDGQVDGSATTTPYEDIQTKSKGIDITS